MADITKCNNENCKIKEDCYRFTSLAGKHQSYMFMDKVVKRAADCDHFWDNEK